MTLIFVQDCRVMIFAKGDVGSCRRGGRVSAHGRLELYDLYPTMETFFISADKVTCS